MDAVRDDTVCINSKKCIAPRELLIPEGISAKALQSMDAAITNFRSSNVSEKIDLSDF